MLLKKTETQILIEPYIEQIKKGLFERDGVALCYIGSWLISILIKRYMGKNDVNQYKKVDDFISEHDDLNEELEYIAMEAFDIFIEVKIPELHRIIVDARDKNDNCFFNDFSDILCGLNLTSYSLEEKFLDLQLIETYDYYLHYAEARIRMEEEHHRFKMLREKENMDTFEKYAKELPNELRVFSRNKTFKKSNFNELLDFLSKYNDDEVGAALMVVDLKLSNAMRNELFLRYQPPKIQLSKIGL